MTSRLVLHVGAMKTGTTYLQNVLQANAAHLGEQGWAVPGQVDVVQATRQLIGLEGAVVGPGPAGVVPDLAGAPRWVALMDDARRADRTVVSMEFLSYARPEGVDAVVAGAHGVELDVVLTVRDAVRALPSQWQSLTRNGFAWSWPDFATGVAEVMRGRPHPVARQFLRTQRIPRMVQAWSRAAPRERFAVVTVPEAGQGLPRETTWLRFCEVLGVDPSDTVTDVGFDNPQLGYGSCELLRQVNAALALPADRPYRKVVRRLTHEHLLPLRDGQSRHRLDEATARLARRLNRRTLAAVAEHATLVGDGAELPDAVGPDDDLDPGGRPAEAPAHEVREAAGALLAGGRALCAELGLVLRPDLDVPLPADPVAAVRLVAGVVGVAVTGEESHRLPPPGVRTSTVPTD